LSQNTSAFVPPDAPGAPAAGSAPVPAFGDATLAPAQPIVEACIDEPVVPATAGIPTPATPVEMGGCGNSDARPALLADGVLAMPAAPTAAVGCAEMPAGVLAAAAPWFATMGTCCGPRGVALSLPQAALMHKRTKPN
jgi:hypothetical protein